MAKKISVGVNGTAHKGTKIWVGGTDDKARKGKKAWIGDASGKARLFFSGTGRYLYTSTTLLNAYYSEDAKTWLTAYDITNGITACCYGLGKFWIGDSEGYVYYSTDCVTWTRCSTRLASSSSDSNTNHNYIQRLSYFSDGYIYAFMTLAVSGMTTTTNWAWKTKDGITWTSALPGIYAMNQQIEDVKYGNVHGTYRYIVSTGTDNVRYIPATNAMSSAFSVLYSRVQSNKGAIALSIRNNTLCIVYRRNSDGNLYAAYTRSKSDGFIEIGKTIQIGGQYAYLYDIASTDKGMLIISTGNTTYLFDGTNVTQKANFPSGFSTHSSSSIFTGIWDGEKRVVFLGLGASATIAYTDDYGATWTLETGTSPSTYGVRSCCYEGDYGGYYSE